MRKYQYDIDKQNRLFIIRKKDKILVPGTFTSDRKNNLIYKLSKNKVWRQKYALAPAIVFEGKWELDKKHNLIFALRKTGHWRKTQKIYLRAQIDEVKANSLIFAVAADTAQAPSRIKLLKLKGRWQADKNNRLAFLVQRNKNQHDALILQGEWSVEKNTLVYRYRGISLKTKKKKQILLRFKGFWQFNESGRLSYVLDADKSSGFSFRLHKGPNSIRAEKGVIKYRLGLGLASKKKTLELFGVWKWKDKSSLNFQINYGKGKIRAINFSFSLKLSKNRKITAVLRNARGDDLGVRLEIEKKILNSNGRIFMRAGKIDKDSRIECGVNLRF